MSQGDQKQAGGAESTNLQAGRDLVVQLGLSQQEVRDVAERVFKENFLRFQGEAKEVAEQRATEITESFLARFSGTNKPIPDSVADPDFLYSLFNVQRDYARSGDSDLGEVLLDLLVDRAEQATVGMRSIVLNEAIQSAPKLTPMQRRAIGALFVLKYARWTGELNLDDYYTKFVRGSLLPIFAGMRLSMSDLQHIEYVGAGSIGISSRSFEGLLRRSSKPWFTNGFPEGEIPVSIRELALELKLVVPSIRDKSKLQLKFGLESELRDALESCEAEVEEGDRNSLWNLGEMTDPQIREDVVDRVPELAEVIDSWKTPGLGHLSLTTVGLAIGHGYWTRSTGQSAPLGIWIPD